MWREGRFRITTIVVLAMLVLATLASARYYQYVSSQHAQASEKERDVWENQDAKNPHSAAHYGTYAFKPKYPLSLIDPGVDKYTGVAIFLEAHKRHESSYMTAQDQTGLSRFGELTPDFILLFIMPLLIIIVGFNIVSSEKETGTYRLIHSLGINQLDFIRGKWIALMIPVVLITFGILLIAGILISLLPDYGVFEPQALLILFLVLVLYYGIYTNITLWISSLAKNSHWAFLALLCFWIISSLALPKFSTNLADSLYPYATQQEFNRAVAVDKSKGLNGHDPWSEEAKKLEAETLAAYKVEKVEDLPFNFDGYLMQKGEEHEAEIYFKHYELLKEQYQNQSKVYQATAFLSPFLPVRFLSMALCRTDYQEHWHFNDAAEQYRISLMKSLNDHFAENTQYGDWAYKADPDLWKDMPRFNYEPPTMSSIVADQSINIILLLAWFMVSYVGMLRSSNKIQLA